MDNFGLIVLFRMRSNDFSYNFCLCNSTFADKITIFSSNTQKYLHISQKSSTFAPAFVIFALVNRNASAIVAQLVEQRIRNAWVAGSSPASGSKRRRGSFPFLLFYTHSHEREPLIPKKRFVFFG